MTDKELLDMANAEMRDFAECVVTNLQAFADELGLSIVGEIPRSSDIIRFEEMGKTVIEGDPELEVSKCFLKLADELLAAE